MLPALNVQAAADGEQTAAAAAAGLEDPLTAAPFTEHVLPRNVSTFDAHTWHRNAQHMDAYAVESALVAMRAPVDSWRGVDLKDKRNLGQVSSSAESAPANKSGSFFIFFVLCLCLPVLRQLTSSFSYSPVAFIAK